MKPTVHRGLSAIAAAIAHEFDIPCVKQHIKRWQEHNPPFPTPNSMLEFPEKECFDWVREHSELLKKRTNGHAVQPDLIALGAEAKNRQAIAQANLIEVKSGILDGKYIDRGLAERTIVGALRKYHAAVRAAVERSHLNARCDKLKELGASPEIIAAFLNFDSLLSISAIEYIESLCETLSHEAANEIAA